MKFKNLNNRIQDYPIRKWLIDWEGDSLSDFQATCKDFFYDYWKNDVVCEEFRIGRMSIDFLNITKRIAVEIQGRQHSMYVPFMAGSRMGYLNQLKRDESKRKWCSINQISLYEIHPKDLPLTKKWIEETWGEGIL
jgi:hypothetical protein